MKISFTIPIEPVAKGRPRFTKSGRTYTPDKTVKFEQSVQWYWKSLKTKWFFEGPVRMKITFFMKIPKKKKYMHPAVKPDCDNLFKAISDALNGFAYKDDSQITHVEIKKRYSIFGPDINISIEDDDALI